MLLVHTVLCDRAKFSIDWHRTSKHDYLSALASEIAEPGKEILDVYLRNFIAPPHAPGEWEIAVQSIKGLDGGEGGDTVEGRFSDPAVSRKYREFEQGRGYDIQP